MFTSNADELSREVVASYQQLQNHLEPMEDLIRAYHGRVWNGNLDATSRYDQHTYEYVSSMVPRLVHQAPAVTIDTSRGGRQQVLAQALERGLNHWAAASRLHEPLEEIAQDAMFAWGGAFVEEVPNDRMTLNDAQRAAMKGSHRRTKSVAGEYPEDVEKPYWPRVRRLEPGRWGWDAAASSESQIRFWWHKVTEDKNELMRRARASEDDWYVDRVASMKTTTDRDELGYSYGQYSTPDRKQVTYYVVWVPDGEIDGEKPKDDEHGVIYTLSSEAAAEGVTGEFIRRPYYFYGPPQGPYCKMGFYRVPRSTVPLSPTVAVYDQADIVARVNQAIVTRIERYKRGVMFDLKDKKDLERIRDAKDDDLVGVSGLTRDGVVPMELGGATQQDLGHHSWLKEQLQTASGMDDAQRGNVTGQGTATEVAVASESAQHRTGYLVQKWREFVADCIQRVAWYAAHDDRVIFTYKVEEDQRMAVAEEAVQNGMMPPEDAEAFMRYGTAMFQGGDFQESGDDLAFEDLDLRIEPYSMQRRDQRTRKIDLVESMNLLTQFAGASAQGVPIDLGKVADLLADVYQMPELEDVVNRQMAQQLGVLSMEERVVAMQADAESAREKPAAGGKNAQGRRSESPQGGGGQASSARSQSGGASGMPSQSTGAQ